MALCELLPARTGPTQFFVIYFKYKSDHSLCLTNVTTKAEPYKSQWSCQEKDLHLGQRNLVTAGFNYTILTLTDSFRTYRSIKIAACAIWPRPVLQAIFFHSFISEQLPLFISMSKISHWKSERGVLAINYMQFQGIPTRLEQLNIIYVKASVKKLHILSLKNTVSHNPEENLPVSSLAFYACRCWGNNRKSHLQSPTFPYVVSPSGFRNQQTIANRIEEGEMGNTGMAEETIQIPWPGVKCREDASWDIGGRSKVVSAACR